MMRPASAWTRVLLAAALTFHFLPEARSEPHVPPERTPTVFAVVGFGDAVVYPSGWCPARIQLSGIPAGRAVTTTFWRSRGDEEVFVRARHESNGSDTNFRMLLPPDPRNRGPADAKHWVRVEIDGESSATLGPFEIGMTNATMLISVDEIEDSSIRQEYCVVRPAELPRDLAAFGGVDVIVLRGLGPRDLDPELRAALLHAALNGVRLIAAPAGGNLPFESWEDLLPARATGTAEWPEVKPTERDRSEFPRLVGLRLETGGEALDTPSLLVTRTWGRGRIGVLAADPIARDAGKRVKAELGRLGYSYSNWELSELFGMMVLNERVNPWLLSQSALWILLVLYPLLAGAVIAFLVRRHPGRVTAAILGLGVVGAILAVSAWRWSDRHERLEVIEVFPHSSLVLRHRVDSPGRLEAPARTTSTTRFLARSNEPLSFGWDIGTREITTRRLDLPFYAVEVAAPSAFAGFVATGDGAGNVRIRNGSVPLEAAFFTDGSDRVPLGRLDADEEVSVGRVFPKDPEMNAEEREFFRYAAPIIVIPQGTGIRVVGRASDGRIFIIHTGVRHFNDAFTFENPAGTSGGPDRARGSESNRGD